MAADTIKDPTLNRLSFIVLILAVCFFFYMAFIRTADQNKKYFNTLTQNADAERNNLASARIKAIKESRSKDTEPAAGDAGARGMISDVPTLLQKISEEMNVTGVDLSNVKKSDASTFQLTAEASFYRLVNFIFQIERANLAVQSMSIRPSTGHKNLIDLTLNVISGEMSENNRKNLKAFPLKYAKTSRDPFQKGAASNETPGGSDEIDLTWEFKLTGIGVDKAPYANINHRNYYAGDELNGMRITGIQPDRIDLKSDSQKFFIGFRKPAAKK